MKLPMHSIIVALLLTGSAARAAGPSSSLLPTLATDQVPGRLQTAAKSAAIELDRQPVSVSWALEPGSSLDARPQVFEQASREYWIDASADQLRQGLPLSTSARGAVIRLSPHAGTAGTLDATTLGIRAGGRLYTSADALRSTADEESLRAAGMQVPQGSVVFRLADSIEAGAIEIIAPTAQGDYLVHVFEPASSVVLRLQADRDTVLSGGALVIQARVEGGAKLDRLTGLLNSPDGHAQDVNFTRQADGSYRASVRPDPGHAGGFGLWEIHAFGQTSDGRISVPRDARNAFAVSIPTARLAGSIERPVAMAKEADVNLRIAVEVAVASRYQLAGVLYGTRPDGSLAPAAVAHSAAWLDRGSAAIDLRFDAAALGQSALAAPYELRDLRLINQADMSLIERRERAASLR
jgi:hypothetical protein